MEVNEDREAYLVQFGSRQRVISHELMSPYGNGSLELSTFKLDPSEKNLNLQNSESFELQDPDSPIDEVEVISSPIWDQTNAGRDRDNCQRVTDPIATHETPRNCRKPKKLME